MAKKDMTDKIAGVILWSLIVGIFGLPFFTLFWVHPESLIFFGGLTFVFLLIATDHCFIRGGSTMIGGMTKDRDD